MNQLPATARWFPGVDESADRLHRAGWSMGELLTAGSWLVMGINGDVN